MPNIARRRVPVAFEWIVFVMIVVQNESCQIALRVAIDHENLKSNFR